MQNLESTSPCVEKHLWHQLSPRSTRYPRHHQESLCDSRLRRCNAFFPHDVRVASWKQMAVGSPCYLPIYQLRHVLPAGVTYYECVFPVHFLWMQPVQPGCELPLNCFRVLHNKLTFFSWYTLFITAASSGCETQVLWLCSCSVTKWFINSAESALCLNVPIFHLKRSL